MFLALIGLKSMVSLEAFLYPLHKGIGLLSCIDSIFTLLLPFLFENSLSTFSLFFSSPF